MGKSSLTGSLKVEGKQKTSDPIQATRAKSADFAHDKKRLDAMTQAKAMQDAEEEKKDRLLTGDVLLGTDKSIEATDVKAVRKELGGTGDDAPTTGHRSILAKIVNKIRGDSSASGPDESEEQESEVQTSVQEQATEVKDTTASEATSTKTIDTTITTPPTTTTTTAPAPPTPEELNEMRVKAGNEAFVKDQQTFADMLSALKAHKAADKTITKLLADAAALAKELALAAQEKLNAGDAGFLDRAYKLENKMGIYYDKCERIRSILEQKDNVVSGVAGYYSLMILEFDARLVGILSDRVRVADNAQALAADATLAGEKSIGHLLFGRYSSHEQALVKKGSEKKEGAVNSVLTVFKGEGFYQKNKFAAGYGEDFGSAINEMFVDFLSEYEDTEIKDLLHREFDLGVKRGQYNVKNLFRFTEAYTYLTNAIMKQYPKFAEKYDGDADDAGANLPEDVILNNIDWFLQTIYEKDIGNSPIKIFADQHKKAAQNGTNEEKEAAEKRLTALANSFRQLFVEFNRMDQNSGSSEAYGMKKGSTISDRNIASVSVARALNLPDLLANARGRLMVKKQGQHPEQGILMDEAKGELDASKIEKVGIADGVFHLSAEAVKKLVSLQVLDNICGQIDRHTDNMIYTVEKDKDGHVTGITDLQGIDNDMSFGLKYRLAGRGEGHIRGIRANDGTCLIPHVPKSLYDSVMAMTEEEIRGAMAGYLDEESIAVTASRLKEIQQVFKKAATAGKSSKDNPITKNRFIWPDDDPRWGEQATLLDFTKSSLTDIDKMDNSTLVSGVLIDMRIILENQQYNAAVAAAGGAPG